LLLAELFILESCTSSLIQVESLKFVKFLFDHILKACATEVDGTREWQLHLSLFY